MGVGKGRPGTKGFSALVYNGCGRGVPAWCYVAISEERLSARGVFVAAGRSWNVVRCVFFVAESWLWRRLVDVSVRDLYSSNGTTC